MAAAAAAPTAAVAPLLSSPLLGDAAAAAGDVVDATTMSTVPTALSAQQQVTSGPAPLRTRLRFSLTLGWFSFAFAELGSAATPSLLFPPQTALWTVAVTWPLYMAHAVVLLTLLVRSRATLGRRLGSQPRVESGGGWLGGPQLSNKNNDHIEARVCGSSYQKQSVRSCGGCLCCNPESLRRALCVRVLCAGPGYRTAPLPLLWCAGQVFGLYEGFITKVLFRPTCPARGPP